MFIGFLDVVTLVVPPLGLAAWLVTQLAIDHSTVST